MCFDDANVCFWTDGTLLSQPEALTACQQRKDFFLMRITNRFIAGEINTFLLFVFFPESDFWIDVRAVVVDNIRWIDGSSLAGRCAFC